MVVLAAFISFLPPEIRKQTFTALWSKSVTICTLRAGARLQILTILQFTVMKSTYISVFRHISLHKALLKCPLTVSKVSVLRLIKSMVGGGYSLSGPTWGGSAQKGYLFQASGI